MQNQADAARLGRLRVRELELTEYLRLADDHRIETRADAEQMTRGVAAGETVNRFGELGLRDSSDQRTRNLSVSSAARDASVATPTTSTRLQVEISAASVDRGRRFAQPAERGNDLIVGKRKPLAQRDGGAAMVYPHDE